MSGLVVKWKFRPFIFGFKKKAPATQKCKKYNGIRKIRHYFDSILTKNCKTKYCSLMIGSKRYRWFRSKKQCFGSIPVFIESKSDQKSESVSRSSRFLTLSERFSRQNKSIEIYDVVKSKNILRWFNMLDLFVSPRIRIRTQKAPESGSETLDSGQKYASFCKFSLTDQNPTVC